MSDRPLVRVDIRANGPGTIKVVWNEGAASFPPYLVDAGHLEYRAKGVRSTLRTLVEDGMQNSWGQLGGVLKKLAKSGNDLYEALLQPIADTGPCNDEIRAWLVSRPIPAKIVFSVDHRIYVPWGLIYSDDPERLPETSQITDCSVYEGFWCFKHLASCVYFRMRPLTLTDTEAERSDVLTVINESSFRRAAELLSDGEKRIWSWVEETFGPPLLNGRSFLDFWRGGSMRVALVHFFCHADGHRLALSETDMLTIHDIRLAHGKGRITRMPCLMFLNGCSTAVGSTEGGFIELTGEEGFCGFIGTETNVPDVFALRFGVAFLKHLLDGGTTASLVMDKLRRAHWPLGIVYSTCCHPDFRISRRSAGVGLLELAERNFSGDILGAAIM